VLFDEAGAAEEKRKKFAESDWTGVSADTIRSVRHERVHRRNVAGHPQFGCPAFRNNRVYMHELQSWLVDHPAVERRNTAGLMLQAG